VQRLNISLSVRKSTLSAVTINGCSLGSIRKPIYAPNDPFAKLQTQFSTSLIPSTLLAYAWHLLLNISQLPTEGRCWRRRCRGFSKFGMTWDLLSGLPSIMLNSSRHQKDGASANNFSRAAFDVPQHHSGKFARKLGELE